MRRPRLDFPGTLQHLTQRGVNRAATFLDDEDFSAYLQALDDCAERHEVSLHGYVLMTNHVHLLVSAPTVGSSSRMMQAVGRRYVRAFNAIHGRTGTLWEGRYKSCLVDSDCYALTCLRYIELNPVRAAMVEQPEDYRWSSARAHLGLCAEPRLTPMQQYLTLGNGTIAATSAYRELLSQAILDDELAEVRNHLHQERALGSVRFQAMVEKSLNRHVAIRPPGRPKRQETISNANAL